MGEVRNLRQNGFGVASTFCGGGGSSLGYRMAGFRVLWANEFVPAARETYEANKAPYTIVDDRDIRKVDPREVLEALKMKEGELDVFDGSPPCASFSTAGKRQKGWGETRSYSDVEQRTDDLFFEFARLVRGIRPKTFVAENVSGLVKGAAKGYFFNIVEELDKCGYNVRARLLDAQWLGVPQQRKRVIILGVRKDLGAELTYPKPFQHRYSIDDALDGLAQDPPPKEVWIGEYAIGREWRHLREGQQSTRYFSLVRPSSDFPCPTVTAEVGNVSAASVTHPREMRKFTIPELKRICSFPDDFTLTGDYRHQCERMGRSVPPLMMRAVALELARALSHIAKRGG